MERRFAVAFGVAFGVFWGFNAVAEYSNSIGHDKEAAIEDRRKFPVSIVDPKVVVFRPIARSEGPVEESCCLDTSGGLDNAGVQCEKDRDHYDEKETCECCDAGVAKHG